MRFEPVGGDIDVTTASDQAILEVDLQTIHPDMARAGPSLQVGQVPVYGVTSGHTKWPAASVEDKRGPVADHPGAHRSRQPKDRLHIVGGEPVDLAA